MLKFIYKAYDFWKSIILSNKILLTTLGKTVGSQLSSELKNVEKKVLETKTCVDKQMDEMQRKREQTFKDISARLDNSALKKDLDNLR